MEGRRPPPLHPLRTPIIGRRVREHLMQVTRWPDRYEAIIRSHLSLLVAEDKLSPDTVLADQGLDSLATVALLVEIEEGFQVTFPDELLNGETFATAGTLWSAVDKLVCGSNEAGPQ